MKAITNPVFWADVATPLFERAKQGDPVVRVIITPRDFRKHSVSEELEVEVRIVRVGSLRLPRRRTR